MAKKANDHWRIQIKNLDSNYNHFVSHHEKHLLLELCQIISVLAAQEQDLETQQILKELDNLDTQVKGDHHPQALEWILNSCG